MLSHLWLSHHCQVRSETEAPASLTPQQPYLHSDSGGSDASSTPAAAAGAANSRNGGVMDPLQKAAATAVAAAGGLNSRNGGAADSLQKLQRVLRLCDECGVIRQPVLLGGLLLVPLLSWHHKVSVGRVGRLPRTCVKKTASQCQQKFSFRLCSSATSWRGRHRRDCQVLFQFKLPDEAQEDGTLCLYRLENRQSRQRRPSS